jgi:hypothetical protein
MIASLDDLMVEWDAACEGQLACPFVAMYQSVFRRESVSGEMEESSVVTSFDTYDGMPIFVDTYALDRRYSRSSTMVMISHRYSYTSWCRTKGMLR